MRIVILFVTLLMVISCPRPTIKEVPELEYIREAKRIYHENPIRAYHLLQDNVAGSGYARECGNMLLRIYLDQREYALAARLLDSLRYDPILPSFERNMILMKTEQWQRLIASTDDVLLQGIASYRLGVFDDAIDLLSKEEAPEDYRLIYLAKAYVEKEDYDNALKAIFLINSISDYLFDSYQEILFKILLELPNLTVVQTELKSLKDPALRAYVQLRVYQKMRDKKRQTSAAWNLIINYPQSPGAYYALKFVTPKTKPENKSYGRVLYYNNEYAKALKYLKRGVLDDAAQYYLGRIYYDRGEHTAALQHFAACSWSAAYYYRGRIYESRQDNDRAIAIYDSLAQLRKGNEYAVRGSKRKAFLLEELGDTLNAVEAFLSINERNTQFRAAMQLFRIGDVSKALQVLEKNDTPEFVYWQIRARERLAEPVESLQQYLPTKFPLSYYTLVRYDRTHFLDTLPLNRWLSQIGDTIVSFTAEDSLHLKSAIRFFSLNESEHAIEELEMIETDNPSELVQLSRICAQYAADKQSIRYCLRVKSEASDRGIYTLPIELLRLQYPIRYSFSIMDNYPEPTLALAMIWQESLFDPYAISPANAKGLMQIIPSTAKTIARALGEPEYTYSDPKTSITFGMYYFKKMLEEFNSIPLALAAYNAGPVRVRRWVRNDPNSELDTFIELIPYNETRNYVKSILGRQRIYRYLIENL